MSMLVRMVLGGDGRSAENPAKPLTDASLRELWEGAATSSGVPVTRESALRLAVVQSCIKVVAEDVAALPWHLYRRIEPRGKERAHDHPLYNLLRYLPNPEMTSFEVRENLVGHVLSWGWAYCEIEFDNAGRRRALWPLRPDRMEQTVNEANERVFVYTLPNGERVGLPRWRVWAIRGWSMEALAAQSLIEAGRESIGLGIAAEQFGSRFFANDSRPGGILKAPTKLSDTSSARMKKSWQDAHAGLTNAHRVAVMEEGVEWQTIGVAPENAQFLETRKYQRSEIAGLFRVPLHKIGDLERATFSNIEQQDIEYVNDVLIPVSTRFDQTVFRDLLSPLERKTYFAEHFLAGRMRGEQLTRYQAYAVGIQNAFLCPDDVREAENMNPIPDGKGQVFLAPLNMMPLGAATAPDEEPDGAAQGEPSSDEEGNDGEATD